MTTDSLIQVSVASLVSAVHALVRAARYDEAAALLDSTTGSDPAIEVARSEVAVALDWYRGTHLAHDALEAARKVVADDPLAAWDVDFLTVKQKYAGQVLGDNGFRVGGSSDEAATADLRRHVEAVCERAPDDQRRGWAEMYHGLILDNVLDERPMAPAHYETALHLAEKTGDDHLIFEALRHLGDHAHDGGDQDLARERWERSTESAARAGAVVGTLAQQILLAQLAREAGDDAGARFLAREVSRWAGALGAHRHKATADDFLAGADPTKRPTPTDDETETT